MKYFFAEEWRGRLKVESMRLFDDFNRVVEHCIDLKNKEYFEIEDGLFRAYSMEENAQSKPKLINKQVIEEVLRRTEI